MIKRLGIYISTIIFVSCTSNHELTTSSLMGKIEHEINHLNFSNALNIIDSMLVYSKPSMVNDTLKYNLLSQKLKILNDFQFDYHERIQTINTIDSLENFGRPLDEIQVLKSLLERSSFLHSRNMSSYALSQLDLGISKISKKTFDKNLNIIRGEFLKSKASILLNEPNPRKKELEIIINQSIEIFKEHKMKDEIIISQIHLALMNIRLDNLEEAFTILDDVKQNLHESAPFCNYYFWINFGFLHMRNENYTEALLQFEKALEFVQHEVCSKFYFYTQWYIITANISLDRYDNAKSKLAELSNTAGCPTTHTKWKEFYLSELKEQLIEDSSINEAALRDSILSLKINRNLLAEDIFFDSDEHHLGDLFAESCADILSFVHSHFDHIPSNQRFEILNLIEKEKRKRYEKSTSKRDSLNNRIFQIESQINPLLRDIDDFYASGKYSSVIYSKLANLYRKKEFYINQLEHSKNDFKVDLDALSFFSKNHLILIFISYKTDQYLIEILDEKMELKKYDFADLGVSKSDTIQSIIGKYSLSENIEGMEFDHIIIIPDERNFNMPFDIDCNYKYIYRANLEAILRNEQQQLNLGKISLFSYSDSKTMSSIEPRSLIELVHGFKEVRELNDLMTYSKVIYGCDFTYQRLEEELRNEQLVHLSTHGFSNSSLRQDCYLVLRDSNCNPINYYSTDIEQVEQTPDFIVLSTCDSGEGIYRSGQGVYSLASAFLSNTTQTVLKTLWKVDDEATMHFMIKFYERWLTGISVLDAQYEAKQYMQDSTEFSHPYYWAGFALEGNPNLYLK